MRRVLLLAAALMIMGGTAMEAAQAAGVSGAAGLSGAAGAAPAVQGIGAAPAVRGIGAAPAASATPPPTTAPPTTAPPTTAPPAPPTTSAPAPPPTQPASPSPSSTSPSPSVSGSPTAGSGKFNLIYLWIALAVIAAIVLIAVVSSVARGRAARRRAWRTRAGDAYNRGSGLFQAVQAATQASQYRDPSAGNRWMDVQARAEDMSRTLQSLRANAPGEYERARADDAINALDALRSASQAGDQGAGQRLQARLREFEDAMQALRDQQ